MIDAELLRRWCWMFSGNKTAWGETDPPKARREPVTPQLHLNHLTVGPGIGIYPMQYTSITPEFRPLYLLNPQESWIVRWGCVDVDSPDRERVAMLCAVLEAHGITGWVEQSRSKGFHVWVFSQDWVSARVMRRALLEATVLAGMGTVEVFPKQEELGEGQLGNFVRLPYPFGAERQKMQASWTDLSVDPMPAPLSLEEFVNTAWGCLTDKRRLACLADAYSNRKQAEFTTRMLNSRPVSDSMVERALQALEAAEPGGRNNALNKAAFLVARKQAVGVDVSGWTDRLVAAARKTGLRSSEIIRTIRSAERAAYR